MRSAHRTFLFLATLSCGSLPAQDDVEGFWAGALASDHLEVRARISTVTDSVRLVACPFPCIGDPFYSPYASADSAHDRVARLVLHGLLPDREYQYRFEVNGVLDTATLHTGYFSTPHDGPFSYSFVTGSCNTTGTHPVWQAMRERDPLFFLSLGDLHYRDPNSLALDDHWDPYRTDVLSVPPMQDLLHAMPIAHVWDDHDFCGDASDGSSLGKYNAARAFRDYVPHYGLHHQESIHQSFTMGRVHFVLSDLRSTRSSSSMMDIEQFVWLQNEFRFARDHGLITAWISPLTWNSTTSTENWGGQPAERTLLNDFLFAEQIQNLFILSGDAHMLAIDDGWNADFSTNGDHTYLYPIFQAAAIARTGSYKGGVFDQGGYFPNTDMAHGQFGEVLVNDDGDEICITFQGWRTDSLSPAISLVNSYTFCRTPSVGIVETGSRTAPFLRSSSGILYCNWPHAHGTGTLELFDVTGRALLHAPIQWQDGQTRMAVPDPAQGMLLVRVTTGDQSFISRLVLTGNLSSSPHE